MVSFSLGAGPCTFMVAAELFPLGVRGFALGVATLLNRTVSGLVALTFLSLSEALTPAVTYYCFAGIAALAFLFIRGHVPETKGRALEEVEREVTQRHLASAPLVKEAGLGVEMQMDSGSAARAGAPRVSTV